MQDIVLLHGAIGAQDQLSDLAKSLQKKGFSVHLFSFSGHGKQPFEATFGIEQFAAELYQFIIAGNLLRPHVFGYSMGGYVALYLASQKPQLIGKIAALATKLDWTPEGAKKERAMLDPEILQQKVPQFAATLRQRHGEKWVELLKRTGVMMGMLGEYPLLGETEWQSMKTPVLLGIGDKDAMVSFEETESVYRLLPDGNLFVLPATKHPIEGVNIDLLSLNLAVWFKG